METRHCLFLAVMLGSVANPVTTYCVIGMDFAINIYHGYRIVKLAKLKGKDDYDGRFDSFLTLFFRTHEVV